VKQSDLGEYEENAREKQDIQYKRQVKSINSRSNQAIWMVSKHKFSSSRGQQPKLKVSQ
jgi:hypothetical protein